MPKNQERACYCISFPLDRVYDVTGEIKPKVVFNFSEVNLEGLNVVNENELKEIINKYENKEIDKSNWVKDDENAYILFTSGNTGKPREFKVSSNNLDSFVDWISPYLNIDGSEK